MKKKTFKRRKKKSTRKAKGISNNENNINNCPICLGKLNNNVAITNCGHRYHSQCLKELRDSHPGNKRKVIPCPLCRKKLTKNNYNRFIGNANKSKKNSQQNQSWFNSFINKLQLRNCYNGVCYNNRNSNLPMRQSRSISGRF